MTFSARVILDSIGPNKARLTTFELTIPRIVLAEFNTHRMFSRNSASSRAIPVEKMLARVKEHPFVPTYWGKNQKGMQADEELSEQAKLLATSTWITASEEAIYWATKLRDLGVHKQITNRLLEPFMWHVVVFTATELTNFIALRDNKMAAPEIQEPARLLVEAYEKSVPMQLEAGEWHLPFVTNYDLQLANRNKRTWQRFLQPMNDMECWVVSTVDWYAWAKVSAARCARTSYLTHEGKRDVAEDAALYEKLVTSGHMSPLEHPAKALTDRQWIDLSCDQTDAWIHNRVPVGNFHGWEQFRKTIAKEHDFSLLQAAE